MREREIERERRRKNENGKNTSNMKSQHKMHIINL